jgi:hypothetical protein
MSWKNLKSHFFHYQCLLANASNTTLSSLNVPYLAALAGSRMSQAVPNISAHTMVRKQQCIPVSGAGANDHLLLCMLMTCLKWAGFPHPHLSKCTLLIPCLAISGSRHFSTWALHPVARLHNPRGIEIILRKIYRPLAHVIPPCNSNSHHHYHCRKTCLNLLIAHILVCRVNPLKASSQTSVIH